MTTTPVLDWRSRHDERSREYPVRGSVRPASTRRPVWWRAGKVLDQGSEGACTGFAASGCAAAEPIRLRGVDDAYARGWYEQAKTLDSIPGEDYSGTSVLATMAAGVARGVWTGYRWCFGVDDVRLAVTSAGPVVIGIDWQESMYETAPGGLVVRRGPVVGGHSLFITGWSPAYKRFGEVFRWRNSWGVVYGERGSGFIRAADLAELLAANGEAALPQR